ncbi:MAG: alanine dehydrogenase [Deltaproteobacteria bacterium]|nr:alanine dehydrogenase [Deltaproteobacteria bacterium]
MIIGVPKEIKDNEYRVALIPSGARALIEAGHDVLIEKNAGTESGFPDEDYLSIGAKIVATAKEAYSADMVVKVKEPLESEYVYLRPGLILFTFLHLASNRKLLDELVLKKVSAIAYETVETPDKRLPILKPMSEVAGRLSVQLGAEYLMRHHGGRGILLEGATGVERGSVVIIGAGIVGQNAAKTALGLGADTLVLDSNPDKLGHIEDMFLGRIKTLISNSHNIEHAVMGADLLVGAVHIPGARTPILVKKELVKKMKKGSIITDVAVDQGGCVETIRPTTHSSPTYVVDGVIHYGVANMPGAVPRTSTIALTNVTLSYLLKLANLGVQKAAMEDSAILCGINTLNGKITNRNLAASFGLEYAEAKGLF